MLIDGLGRGAPTEYLAWSRVEGCSNGSELLVVPASDFGALREVLAKQAVGVLVGRPLPGLWGSARNTGMPVSTVKAAWAASSFPRSHVRDRRSWSGTVEKLSVSASRIDSAP